MAGVVRSMPFYVSVVPDTGGSAVVCGVVRYDVVWCGVLWCGVVYCGVVWCGVM